MFNRYWGWGEGCLRSEKRVTSQNQNNLVPSYSFPTQYKNYSWSGYVLVPWRCLVPSMSCLLLKILLKLLKNRICKINQLFNYSGCILTFGFRPDLPHFLDKFCPPLLSIISSNEVWHWEYFVDRTISSHYPDRLFNMYSTSDLVTPMFSKALFIWPLIKRLSIFPNLIKISLY